MAGEPGSGGGGGAASSALQQTHGLRDYWRVLAANRQFRFLWCAEMIDNIGSWLVRGSWQAAGLQLPGGTCTAACLPLMAAACCSYQPPDCASPPALRPMQSYVATLELVEHFSGGSGLAISGVVIIRFMPSLLLAPVCGVVADR